MANLMASYGGARPVHCLAWEGDIVTLAAVLHRRLDLVQFLLAHGAAVELADDQPWTTPHFWAKHLEEPSILQALTG